MNSSFNIYDKQYVNKQLSHFRNWKEIILNAPVMATIPEEKIIPLIRIKRILYKEPIPVIETNEYEVNRAIGAKNQTGDVFRVNRKGNPTKISLSVDITSNDDLLLFTNEEDWEGIDLSDVEVFSSIFPVPETVLLRMKSLRVLNYIEGGLNGFNPPEPKIMTFPENLLVELGNLEKLHGIGREIFDKLKLYWVKNKEEDDSRYFHIHDT